MKKKGNLETISIIIFSMFVIGILSLIFVGIDIKAEIKAEKESCSKINMEYYYSNEQTYCIDNNNEAHYTKSECHRVSWFIPKYNCIARIITIGDNRVLVKD